MFQININVVFYSSILFHIRLVKSQIRLTCKFLQPQVQPSSHQTIVLNGKIQNQVNRPQPIAPKPRNNDLIDLTDEEEKNKSKFTFFRVKLHIICV